MLINIGIAIVLDLLIGDPPDWPHPIRLIGWIIARIEKWVRQNMKNLVVGGFLLLLGSILCVVLPVMILKAIIPPTFFRIIEIYLLYTCLASKCLAVEALKVKFSLENEPIEASRKQLSYLVGRDTRTLSEQEVTRGVVETVAENTIDGVLAPLFYMLIGAPFGLSLYFVLIYKVINTLDSMVGYIHPPYKEIGFASAKADDLVNLVPARLGAILMIIAGGMIGKNVKNGLKIFFRDRKNHKSPNSGHPESAIAGLLEIQLGGTNTYFGNVVEKPTIGESIRALTASCITDTNRVMFASELLTFAIGAIFILNL